MSRVFYFSTNKSQTSYSTFCKEFFSYTKSSLDFRSFILLKSKITVFKNKLETLFIPSGLFIEFFQQLCHSFKLSFQIPDLPERINFFDFAIYFF